MILLLLACFTNTEPRFQAVNDVEVKHLLGFSFLDPGNILTATAGVPMTLDIQVKDRENDAVQLLFYRSPPGMDFDAHKSQGTWTPPMDYWEPYVDLNVVAVDEHDAMSWLAIPVWVNGLEYDTGDTGKFDAGQWISGEATVGPETFSGTHQYAWLSEDFTYCEWSWPESAWTADPTVECTECEQVWGVEFRRGIALSGDCDAAPLGREVLPFSLGFNSATGRVYGLVESTWIPIGTGQLEEDVLTWDAVIPE